MQEFLEGLYLFLCIGFIVSHLLYGVCLIVYFVFYVKEKLASLFHKRKLNKIIKERKQKNI